MFTEIYNKPVNSGQFRCHTDIKQFGAWMQNGRRIADEISQCIFLNKNIFKLLWISPKIFLKCPIDNKPTLVQAMAWCQTGAKPLPEPMMNNSTDT